MHKMSAQWNQQLIRHLFSEKSNTQMNAKHLKINRLQKPSNIELMNWLKKIQVKLWKYNALECLKI